MACGVILKFLINFYPFSIILYMKSSMFAMFGEGWRQVVGRALWREVGEDGGRG